jgi:FKBP-type peptidyl-prolyl cis-trans isomerase FkpA
MQILNLIERNQNMKSIQWILALLIATLIGACGGNEPPVTVQAIPENPADISIEGLTSEEIVPGLSKRTLLNGDGAVAEVGDMISVHYTGWLYDPEAANFRGAKFDSSVDRGAHFRFRLGEGRVISGWDQGVVGMQIGEVRELTIAPELAYGDRQMGPIIAPGSTLVFVVELAGIDGQEEESEPPTTE